MRIAERNIGDGYAVADFLRGGHSNSFVSERRTANRPQRLVSNHEFVVNFETLANGEKRLPFALLGALAIADVDGRRLVIACRQRGADARIHSTTEEDDCARSLGGRHHRKY